MKKFIFTKFPKSQTLELKREMFLTEVLQIMLKNYTLAEPNHFKIKYGQVWLLKMASLAQIVKGGLKGSKQ
jgi:hypothetical protein